MTLIVTTSVQIAARELKVELDRVYKLIYAGKIAAVKRDGKWAIYKSSLDEYKRVRDAQRA